MGFHGMRESRKDLIVTETVLQVLSPRSWTLLKSEGWPVMKILFHFLRIFVPLEFIVVGVAFFDTNFPLEV